MNAVERARRGGRTKDGNQLVQGQTEIRGEDRISWPRMKTKTKTKGEDGDEDGMME